jgi:hypothetical protein
MRITKKTAAATGRLGNDDNGKTTTCGPDLLERAVEWQEFVVVAGHYFYVTTRASKSL